MDPILNFALHLVIAGSTSWLLVLYIRRILGAINVGTKGKFFEKTKTAGAVLDFLLPVLPCIPSGFIYVLAERLVPSDVMLDNWIYQFCVGMLAGSVASNLYNMITRWIERKATDLTEDKKPE